MADRAERTCSTSTAAEPPRTGSGSSPEHLFVYGTLRSAFGAHGLLAGRTLWVGLGWMEGRLYDTGSYPAAVPPNGPGDRVRGELYRLRPAGAAELLMDLDRYEGASPDDPEGALFRRVDARITADDGRLLSAWVYLFNRPVDRLARIPSGDYASRDCGPA